MKTPSWMGRQAVRPLQLLVGVCSCLSGDEVGGPRGEKQMTDKKRFTTIDEYISTFPGVAQAVLEQVRQAIRHAAPEAVETMSYELRDAYLQSQWQTFGVLCWLETSYLLVSAPGRR